MDINAKIEEIRTRVKDLTSHFPYTEFEINFLTICYIAIASIDNDITDMLDEVFSKVFILFDRGQFKKVLKKAENKKIINYGGIHFLHEDQCEYILVNVYNIPKNKYFTLNLFDIAIHEIKHALNSKINTHVVSGDKEHIYSGLKCDTDNLLNSSCILDETFNDYATIKCLEQIAYLKEDKGINCPEIRQILDSFIPAYSKLFFGYNIDKLLKCLYSDEKLFICFYNAALYRDFDSLYLELAEVTSLPIEDIEKYFNGELKRLNDFTRFCLRRKIIKQNKNNPRRVLEIKPHFENI